MARARHTALTNDAAVGNPNAYVQAKAGHSQFSITERYVHAQTTFPGAVERSEERMFGTKLGYLNAGLPNPMTEKPRVSGAFRSSGGRI